MSAKIIAAVAILLSLSFYGIYHYKGKYDNLKQELLIAEVRFDQVSADLTTIRQERIEISEAATRAINEARNERAAAERRAAAAEQRAAKLASEIASLNGHIEEARTVHIEDLPTDEQEARLVRTLVGLYPDLDEDPVPTLALRASYELGASRLWISAARLHRVELENQIHDLGIVIDTHMTENLGLQAQVDALIREVTACESLQQDVSTALSAERDARLEAERRLRWTRPFAWIGKAAVVVVAAKLIF